MNAPKVSDLDYINFLVAAPRVVSCTEAARVQPDEPCRAAHDAFTRLLQRLEPDPLPLWREAEPFIDRQSGLLIADDTTFDKPYAQQIDLVHRHWSGKHHRVVSGINLLTLLWSDGTDAIPCDYRLFDKPVDGFILVFRIDTTDGDTEYWATSDLTLTIDERAELADQIWTIESYHRGLKQHTGAERCAARSARAQRNHIGWAIRAFLRLEHHRITTGTSWFETKLEIIRPAIQQFLAGPKALLAGFEQATLAHKRATA